MGALQLAKGPGAAAKLELAHVSPELITAHYGPVYIAVWRGKPTWPLFEIQRTQLAAAIVRNPGQQLFMCIVEAKAEPPEQDLRDASAKMVKDHGRNMLGCACVIEGTGFRAAITRTVLSGIVFVARSQTPIRLFDSTASASVWLATRAGHQLEGLAAAFDAARAAHPGPNQVR